MSMAVAAMTSKEVRLNSLLSRAENYVQTLHQLQDDERHGHRSREDKLDLWSMKMCEKIDQVYSTCLNDLRQSFEQLKAFQQLMIQILNNDQENYIDAKKLLAIEHEICILRCLTYQLDTSKVKIEGKLRLNKGLSTEQVVHSMEESDPQDLGDEHEHRELLCRILIEKEMIEKIETLPEFHQSVQMTSKPVHSATPERVLTIIGADPLPIIEQILSTLYASANTQCELRLLLHRSYAPLIVGKLGERSKMLREKYSLHTLTIHPTCAPRSTERVLLMQSLAVEKILACLDEIFTNIRQSTHEIDDLVLYDEMYYDASLTHEYGGFDSSEANARSSDPSHHSRERFDEEEDNVRRYSAFDAWNGSVEADTEHEFSVIKMGEDSIKREFWINHGQFGALLGPHGIRIAQIRSQCRTVRIHTVAGSSIDTCSVQVIGPRLAVNQAVNLIVQSIKEHDRKFPFKHHRFSGRLR